MEQSYHNLTPELEEHIINADRDEQANWLFMEPHLDFPGQWRVDSLVPSFQLNLQDQIGHYRAISPARLKDFLDVCREYEYKLVFVEDPVDILSRYEHLNDPPPFGIKSHLKDTVNGYLPFQVQGFNRLKDLDAAIAMWSTGTGKTALAAGLLQYHSDMDLQWFIVQGDKKLNAARDIKKLGGLDSIILDGTREKCEKILGEIDSAPKGTVIVTNYEKFETYNDWIQSLFTDREIFIIWDEMPTKLKNRGTNLYRSIAKCLYTSASDNASVIIPGRERPKKLKQLMMTATPIERAPEDFFNCISGDIEVQTIGNAERVYRGWWEGPLVKLVTTSGTQLTIGPNHPVLTSKGWINAQFLSKGDYVVRSPIQSSLGVKNFNQPKSTVEDIFNTARTTSQSIRVKGASPFEFHGDGKFFQDKIDIVDIDWKLATMWQSDIVQKNRESVFGLPHQNSLRDSLGDGSFPFGFNRIFSTQSLFRTFGHPSIRTNPAGPTRSKLDSRFLQPVGNQFLADAQLFGDAKRGSLFLNIFPLNVLQVDRDSLRMGGTHFHTSLFESPNDRIIGNPTAESGNVSNCFSFPVELDEIVSIEVIEWSGHIYDLSTSGSTYYANGIVTNNCIRLLDPTIFGTVKEFRSEYVKSYNHFNQFMPEEWHNLEKIGLLTAHIMHQVDKEDPDIAKYFPEPRGESVVIEWNDQHRKVYDIFTDEIKKRRKKQHTDKAELDDQEIFALIGVMQMLCDAPTMVSESAFQRYEFDQLWDQFTSEAKIDSKAPPKKGSEAALRLVKAIKAPLTNDGHPKLKRLREDLTINHPEAKIIVFTVFGNLLLPILSEALDDWKIPHVVYRGTAKQKQEAEDTFREDPNIRVFLSSDAGAEGLNLPEASVSIDYDLPWNYSRKIQRKDRKHRVVSTHKVVYDYTYLLEDSVEDRKMSIIAKKKGYHDAIFKGIINEEALSSRMSKEDLIWLLTGEQD